jgi:hypothetical protein
VVPRLANPRLTKESSPSRTKVEIRSRIRQQITVKDAIAIIIGARIADLGHIQISTNEASGTVVLLTVHFDVGRRTRERSSSLGERGLMVPSYLARLQMQLYQLPLLARMMLRIEINDVDGIMNVEIVMVIEEITEVVEVVVVVESNGIKTKVRPVLPVVSLT